jgi:hypothetical protein
LPLGAKLAKVLLFGAPFRLFSHASLDLKVYYYKDKKLGNHKAKCELLVVNGEFSAAIYYLETNHSSGELKKAIAAKYLSEQDNIESFENVRIIDKHNNELILAKMDFSSILVYTKEKFFQNLISKLDFETKSKAKLIEDELFSRLLSEI